MLASLLVGLLLEQHRLGQELSCPAISALCLLPGDLAYHLTAQLVPDTNAFEMRTCNAGTSTLPLLFMCSLVITLLFTPAASAFLSRSHPRSRSAAAYCSSVQSLTCLPAETHCLIHVHIYVHVRAALPEDITATPIGQLATVGLLDTLPVDNAA